MACAQRLVFEGKLTKRGIHKKNSWKSRHFKLWRRGPKGSGNSPVLEYYEKKTSKKPKGRLFLGKGSTVQLDVNACSKNVNGVNGIRCQICHDFMAEETEMEEAYANQSRIKQAKNKRQSVKKSDSKRLKKKQKEAVSELVCYAETYFDIKLWKEEVQEEIDHAHCMDEDSDAIAMTERKSPFTNNCDSDEESSESDDKTAAAVYSSVQANMRSKRTPLSITKSTWTGRTVLISMVEFHNHKHGHSGSASNVPLSEETKQSSNWSLSSNASATVPKSRLVRMSPVVEFDHSEHGSAPITPTTRCEREKSKQQSTHFMENHLLQQLRRLFSKICDEHKQSPASDDDLEVLRTHICQVESYLAGVRDLKPDRDNFNQQLTNQCAAFVDLNSKAIAACIEFRSRLRLK